MLRTFILLLAAASVLAGCGSSSPEDTVSAFTEAYAADDVEKACSYFDQDGPGGLTDALVEAAGDNPEANAQIEQALGNVKDENDVCTANLGLVRRWDPDPSRTTRAAVKDTDADGENATVSTSEGEWTLQEVDGDWKVSNLDAVIPSRLVVR